MTAPTLALIAEHDKLIPPKHALYLGAAFAVDQVHTEFVANANHDTIGHSRQD